MQQKKIKIYHFNNGSGGGVLSVIKNLIAYSDNSNIENHIIYTINKDNQSYFKLEEIKSAITQKVFYYSSNWNLLHTCKQLSKFIPDKNAILVAHDWLELAMVSNLGLQNKLLYFLHGNYNYYYDLAITNKDVIDAYITVADSIKEKLSQLIPQKKNIIHYCRFPVPDNDCKRSKKNAIVFLGRCTEDKGYNLLPSVALLLAKKGIAFSWHIIGNIQNDVVEKYIWDKTIEVKHYGELQNEQVKHILCDMKFAILPSKAEGMPVSIIEAMKAGVIPIVNNLEGGIQELVINGETGYKINSNSVEEYADTIAYLFKNPEAENKIRMESIALANKLFSPIENVKTIENLYIQLVNEVSINKQRKRVYGSRLDRKWVPNIVTSSIRKITKD